MTNKVSIIILNHNGLSYLKKCIESIKKQSYPDIQIIVTDNASEDGSIEWVKNENRKWIFKDRMEKMEIIAHKKNLGYTGANNRAAKIAKGDYLFFLNNDTELFPDCIEKLILCSREKSIVSACQIPMWNKQFVGSSGTGADIFGYPYVDQDPKKTKVFYADGAMLFMKKKDFFELGGFDDKLFIFQEDIDLSWRAQLSGYKIISCFDAKLYHLGGGTVPGGQKKKHVYVSSYFRRYLNEKNIIRNILKNYSFAMCIIILLGLLFLHFFEIIGLILLLKPRVAACYVKAYWWNIYHIHNTLKTREKIQRARTISDRIIMKQMYWRYSKLASLRSVGIPEFK